MTQLNEERSVKHIVVVGGGTAGWLAAGVLASKLKSTFQITLVESPSVPSIGVGEGSWPSLRDTLIDIGIEEKYFLTACSASFKQGSTFVNWRKPEQTNSHHREHAYHHPFTVPVGYNELDIHSCWQAYAGNEKYENAFSLQAAMCEANKAPKQLSTPDYAHVLNYGYHFDATALATLLHTHCTEKLNVVYKQAHIASVNNDSEGYIASVTTEDGMQINGDLFIDCSGNQGILIDKHYNVPWHSIEDIMLNNRAMAVQAPYVNNDDVISSTTIATAQRCGWTWDIGLQHRRGVGLVYSDQFTTHEQAEETLLAHVSKRLPKENVSELNVRSLRFTPGYRKQFWVKNCLSLGMSSGFIEPLEASAIAMVELGIRMLCEAFPQNFSHMKWVEERYNRRFHYRWLRVIDFLKLHYVLSNNDTPYWLAQRDSSTIPDSLAQLLDVWRFQSPSRLDLIENEEIFPSASYQYVLYGMGFETLPSALKIPSASVQKAQDIRQKMQQTKMAYLQGLPTNRDLLSQIIASKNKEQNHDLIGFR